MAASPSSRYPTTSTMESVCIRTAWCAKASIKAPRRAQRGHEIAMGTKGLVVVRITKWRKLGTMRKRKEKGKISLDKTVRSSKWPARWQNSKPASPCQLLHWISLKAVEASSCLNNSPCFKRHRAPAKPSNLHLRLEETTKTSKSFRSEK